jgi:hypothetical protein
MNKWCIMPNTKKIDKQDELQYYLFTVLKLSRTDQGLETILKLLAKSNIDSSGLLAVKSLIEVVLTDKIGKLKGDIRKVLDHK